MALETVLYAHQGGWDEMLMVAAPIAGVISLLRVAERRARTRRSAEVGDPSAGGPDSQGFS